MPHEFFFFDGAPLLIRLFCLRRDPPRFFFPILVSSLHRNIPPFLCSCSSVPQTTDRQIEGDRPFRECCFSLTARPLAFAPCDHPRASVLCSPPLLPTLFSHDFSLSFLSQNGYCTAASALFSTFPLNRIDAPSGLEHCNADVLFYRPLAPELFSPPCRLCPFPRRTRFFPLGRPERRYSPRFASHYLEPVFANWCSFLASVMYCYSPSMLSPNQLF